MSENNTTFAIAYRRASVQLMDAIASGYPANDLQRALTSALRAQIAAANVIEETLVGDLITSIGKVKPLVMA